MRLQESLNGVIQKKELDEKVNLQRIFYRQICRKIVKNEK